LGVLNPFLILNDHRLKVRVARALVEEVPILMGGMDIFDRFRIICDEKNGWIDFQDNV